MNEKANKTSDVAAPVPVPLDRDAMRAQLLGKTHARLSKVIILWGIEIELRQASLAAMMDASTSDDPKVNAVNMIIRYAYVPGTEERVFEEADRGVILGWPFGEDLTRLQEAVSELTGVDIEAAEEDLQKSPLKD